MAERIADNADFAVDELKRRARRRLVGAIVLALAAAVILPLLLEKEPKPLGDDVSVQIPPVDEGRFINRLTGRSGESKNALKADTKPLPKIAAPKLDALPAPAAPVSVPPAAPESAATTPPAPAPSGDAAPKKSIAEAEQRMLAPTTKGNAKAAPAPAPIPEPKVEAKAPIPEPKVEAKAPTPAAPVATPSPPIADAAAPVAPVAVKAEGFAVQIAAFTDDKGANALAGKLKKAGYAATYTESVETSRGMLWRVRVGGLATRPEAEAMRVKLKSEGWNGLVVAAK
jgi:DedD protein